MAPRKQRPDPAVEGQYRCKRSEWESDGRLFVCNKPVPPGDLTYLALNTPSGSYPILCVDCRQELKRILIPFLGASQGAAQLVASLVTLPNSQLVSEATLREVLKRDGYQIPPRPLKEEEILMGIQREFGTPIANELEAMWEEEKRTGL